MTLINDIRVMADSIETTIYSKFQYTEKDRLKWYTDKKGRTALCFTCAYDGYCGKPICFTCAYDGYCGKPMRYTKCKDYIERKELC